MSKFQIPMSPVVLKNGFVVTSERVEKADVVIKGGKIVEVTKNYSGTGEINDVSGKYVLPGLIDVHVHFREPGNENKEDFATGSKAAIAGGVTTVLDMPNNKPPITTFALLKKKRKLANGKFYCNYGFYFGCSDKTLGEIYKVENVPGLKVYMGSSTGNLLVSDKESLERIFSAGKLVVVHAEDERIIHHNLAQYQDAQGPEKHGLIRNAEVEFSAIRYALHLAKKYNTRLHIAHVSAKDSLKEIRKFKSDRISVEVTPHHLFLTEKDYFAQGHYVKVNPPLRYEEDKLALWKAISSGIIDIVATDHAPHLREEKEFGYDQAPSGVPGLETVLPLLLNSVNDMKLNLIDIIHLTSYNPAKLFGIANKGEITKGFDADLVVVDMNVEKEVRNEHLYTKCGWSPFHGWRLKGWPVMTILSGVVAMQDGKIIGEARGREVEIKN